MKYLPFVATLATTLVTAVTIATPDQAALRLGPTSDGQYLIELSPGETIWVAEEEKWELRRKGINFFDITDTPELESSVTAEATTVTFPPKVAYYDDVAPFLKELSKANMRKHLEKFTSFHTRYYKSTYGVQSADWLLKLVNTTILESGAGNFGAHVRAFKHPWGQNSVIATIPGQTNRTVVIGAHQDSINLFFPSFLAAPGADDDGSGTVTILEALRVLLQFEAVRKGNASNTIEFHWYSAEEGGLLGSQAIFHAYAKEGREVRAMLQQDMTGYIQKTLDAGQPESVGIITDFVHPALTEFIKEIVNQYCTIPYVLTKCGYACSDHASASKAGYPASFVIESDFKYSDNKIHTGDDKIEYLSFDHMIEHARLTLGLVYELAFAPFN
ncbi:Leucine aminopeptidase 1 [Lobaria immixta]|nr:Leucine aminopeptidase 1 [Lobaria immixta]